MGRVRPNCIASGFGRVQDSSKHRNIPSVKDDNKSSRLEVTKPPKKRTIVHENLGIVSSEIPLEETLNYLAATKALPELSLSHKFALMPAEELGLKWFIGERDCTKTMYDLARDKNQSPMVLVSKPIA